MGKLLAEVVNIVHRIIDISLKYQMLSCYNLGQHDTSYFSIIQRSGVPVTGTPPNYVIQPMISHQLPRTYLPHYQVKLQDQK